MWVVFFSFQTMSAHPTGCDIRHFKSNFPHFLVNGCQARLIDEFFAKLSNAQQSDSCRHRTTLPSTGYKRVSKYYNYKRSKYLFSKFKTTVNVCMVEHGWNDEWIDGWIDGMNSHPLTWSKWAELFCSLLTPNHLVGSRKNSAVVGKPGRTVTRSCCSLTPVDYWERRREAI